MSRDTVEDVGAVIEQYLQREVMPDRPGVILERSTPLFETGILDSVTLLAMAAFLEDSYSIRIENHELDVEKLRNIDEIGTLVRAKVDGVRK